MTASLGRVAVTGAGGRLGSAFLHASASDGRATGVAWRRPDYDLDTTDPRVLLERDQPSLVVHCAAWTDVDGCARDPDLAMRRNGEAVGELAKACAASGAGLVVISTNEVFDGTRSDGRGYDERDPTAPGNAYGASKLAGEEAARAAYAGGSGLWVIRTAWLYGPPGNDFPHKIVAAADRLPPADALPVVADEWGSPTFTTDLAEAVLQLVQRVDGGLFHLVNDGVASRYSWAAEVLRTCRPGRAIRSISQSDFVRPSQPPAWGVLDASRARTVGGVSLRPWEAALAEYLAGSC